MKTALRPNAMAITATVTSSIDLQAASRGERPCSIQRSTFSTTTIASSTTTPTASTSPNSEMLLSVNPSMAITAKVPTSDTGTATSGISVERQFCRNRSTTRATSSTASRRALKTSTIDSLMNGVVS